MENCIDEKQKALHLPLVQMRGENDMRLQIGLGYAFVAALLASKDG